LAAFDGDGVARWARGGDGHALIVEPLELVIEVFDAGGDVLDVDLDALEVATGGGEVNALDAGDVA